MRLITLFFLTLILCTSCGGDDDEIQKEGNCLTAVINGEDFTAESTTGVFNIIDVNWEGLGDQETKLLTITGSIPSLTAETRTITLTFACSEFTSTLDYVDSSSDCGISMDYSVLNIADPNSSFAVPVTTGAINVEELTDDRIRGTFTFSGLDPDGTEYNFTNGFFDTTIIQ